MAGPPRNYPVVRLLQSQDRVSHGAASVLRLPKSSRRTRRGRAVGEAFGAIDVLSAEEFYKNADEHFGWAESPKTERERAIFLQMAAAWLEVAQKWDGVNVDASLPRGRPIH